MDLGTPPEPGGEIFGSLNKKGVTENEYRFYYLLTILISFPAGT
jgi:hypothetical protein